MAVNEHLLRFLLFATGTFGVSFARTMTLGRLHCMVAPHRLAAIAARNRLLRSVPLSTLQSLSGQFSEPLFALLGATSIDSIDASPFENATFVHDLNQPVPSALHLQYDCVIDGGTIEHVFNVPIAVTNAMNMVSIGGHFVSIIVANNFLGHGFYQFSPEFFFRVLTPGNGFQLLSIVLCEASRPRRWYKITDPAVLGRRVTLINKRETYLMVLARKVSHHDSFQVPQQSDYEVCWRFERTDARSITRPWGALELFRPIWRIFGPRQQEFVRRWLFGLRGLDPAFRRLDAYALSTCPEEDRVPPGPPRFGSKEKQLP